MVYPVVIVQVEGVKCRALLDTGAGSSYASAALLDRVPKRQRITQVRRIEMMYGATTKEVEIATIKVKAVENQFALDIDVTKVNKGHLLTLENPRYEQILSRYSHLQGVHMQDSDTKEQLPVHLILGASKYARIKTETGPRVGQPGQPVAEHTKFGWTIMSPRNETDNNADAPNTNLAS